MTHHESPMDTVKRTSKLWIGATVIGYAGGSDQMDVQIRLNDGTVVRVGGLVKPDPNFEVTATHQCEGCSREYNREHDGTCDLCVDCHATSW